MAGLQNAGSSATERLSALWAQESAEYRNWLNQGAEAFRSAQCATAIQAFQRAIDLEPSSVTAHLYLATAYMQQYIPGADSNENSQIAARAKEAFSQVLVFDPNDKVALASMASLYLNNLIEQDHRFIKKRITASLGFRSVESAWRTIDGYEAMHAIRKGQIRWLAKGDAVGQRQFIHTLFGIAA